MICTKPQRRRCAEKKRYGMSVKFTIPLKKVIEEFSLEVLYAPDNLEQIRVERGDINRPGLPLSGFFDHFEEQRIQIIGNV